MNFIKLSNIVINTRKIATIRIRPNKYYINVLDNASSGFILAGSGMINNSNNLVEICKKTNEDDYNIITQWINTQTKSVFTSL